MYKENKLRTMIKTITFRIVATLTTILLVYVFYGDLKIAGMIGIIEVVTKLFIYYIHERVWDKIHYGKNKPTAFVLWFTGLSGSGKSALADNISNYLNKQRFNIKYLNNKTMKEIFPQNDFSNDFSNESSESSLSKEEKNSYIKSAGNFSATLEEHGVTVVSSLTSPYRESRDFVRNKCENFIEIYVSTPIEECQKTEDKNKDNKANEGEDFTGTDKDYEAPQNPELTIDTSKHSIEESKKIIINYLKGKYL